jgi:hypothetical protein
VRFVGIEVVVVVVVVVVVAVVGSIGSLEAGWSTGAAGCTESCPSSCSFDAVVVVAVVGDAELAVEC